MIRLTKRNTGEVMKCKMNIKERRELLDSLGGKFYSIEWVKASGELRSCTARHMQHDMFASGHASKAKVSTVAHKPNLYTMVDVTNGKWVNVSLDKLRHVKCGEIDMTFDEE